MSLKITALAITYNEEAHVKRYVENLSFADEIIFVDSYSSDNTVALAESLGVKVYQNEFQDFSSQRNFAITKASNDWVLFFDLDEVINFDLRKEIVQRINETTNNKVAFLIKRHYYFMGKIIKFGGWQSDKAIRVFNKNFCHYQGLVHESVVTTGSVGELKNALDHFSYKSFDNYNDKLNLYSKLQAEHLYEKGIKPSFYHFFIRPSYRFLWQYFFRLGILDGKEGFILAYIHSFSVFKRYLQLWMRYRKIE